MEHAGAGSAAEPAQSLIALHGFMATGATWDSLAAHLPGWHLGAPTFAQHTAQAASFDALAAIVQEHVRAAPAPPILLGYSMGGRIALEYLQRYPDAPISALILESAGLGPKDGAERAQYEQRARSWAQRFRTQAPEDYVQWWESLPVMAAPATANEALRAMRLGCEGESLALLTEAAGPHAMHTQAENLALLARLPVPVLYVAGASDSRYAALASSLQAEGITVAIVGGGHNVHAANPVLFAQLVYDVAAEARHED